MKKLNNKGITTIEVLVCFVLVVIITVSIYTVVSDFNEKKIVEGYREELLNYKNLLTKEIQDDFIKIGLTHATYEKEEIGEKNRYILHCSLKDGTERVLIVEQLLAKSSYHIGGSTTSNDEFLIQYGDPANIIDWELPDLGSYPYDPVNEVICTEWAQSVGAQCLTVKDLSINNVLINITDDNVLSIYIGFYHPEFGTKYAINIVCPIDYMSSGYNSASEWDY